MSVERTRVNLLIPTELINRVKEKEQGNYRTFTALVTLLLLNYVEGEDIKKEFHHQGSGN